MPASIFNSSLPSSAATSGRGRIVNGRWVPNTVASDGVPPSTGTGGTRLPPITWGPGGTRLPSTGGIRPITGGTIPPTNGNYPSDPVPFPTLPTMPAPTDPAYIGNPNPTPTRPPSGYNPDYDPLADLPELPTVPTIGTWTGGHEASDFLDNFLDSGGYNVSAVDPDTDPYVSQAMRDIRNNASRSAIAAGHAYQRNAGLSQGSAGSQAMRTALRLTGAGNGLSAANTFGLDASKYLTGLKADSIARALQAAGLLGQQETDQGNLFYKGQDEILKAYQSGLDRYNAALARAGLGRQSNQDIFENWIASQANDRANQGTYDTHGNSDLARWQAQTDATLRAYQLQLEQQRLADERARQAATGPYGTGEVVMTQNPDGTYTITTRQPTSGGGGTIGGGATGGNRPSTGVTVPAPSQPRVSDSGVVMGQSGQPLVNRLQSRVQQLAAEIANTPQSGPGTFSDNSNDQRIAKGEQLRIYQAATRGPSGPAYDNIRRQVVQLADQLATAVGALRSDTTGSQNARVEGIRNQITNLLASLGTGIASGATPAIAGGVWEDTTETSRANAARNAYNAGLRQGNEMSQQQAPQNQPQQQRRGFLSEIAHSIFS